MSIALLVTGYLDTSYSSDSVDSESYVLRYSNFGDESTNGFSIEEVIHGNPLDEYFDVSIDVSEFLDETPFLFTTVRSNRLVEDMTFPVFDIVSDRYEFLTDWIEREEIDFYIDYSAVERVWVPIACNIDHKKCQSELDIIGDAYRRSQHDCSETYSDRE